MNLKDGTVLDENHIKHIEDGIAQAAESMQTKVEVTPNEDGSCSSSHTFDQILEGLKSGVLAVMAEEGESGTEFKVFHPSKTFSGSEGSEIVFSSTEGPVHHLLHFYDDNTVEYEVVIEDSEESPNEIVDTALGVHSVITAGAVGDGVHNDTEAFEMALKNNRKVFVPGGTYVLSDTLVIRENCCLELSQDTVLRFTQTEGDCIEMRSSAVLWGNHAVIAVSSDFAGHVIDIDTLDENDFDNQALHATAIPPFTKPGPAFKYQRFVHDVNIVKFIDNYGDIGFCSSPDGTCSGTGIYISATNVPTSDENPENNDISYIWAMTLSGIRIRGGFSYGIHAINFDSGAPSPEGYTDDAWNHDMRIEAVIEACEIGVALENCNGAHLQVTVQPCAAVNGTAYAKHGIYLNDSRFVDLIGSRVWDWHNKDENGNSITSKWEPGNEWQHLALVGNCRGLLLDDFNCTETAAYEIRDLIYTDTPANFETMTILQEPGNKRFKSVDGAPYFNDGVKNRRLMLATDKFSAEQAEFIQSADGYYTYVPNYTNLVDGYHDGYYLSGKGALVATVDPLTTTDYIPVDGSKMHTYRIGGEGIKFNGSEFDRVEWYDADKNVLGAVMPSKFFGTSEYYPAWVEDESVAGAFITLSTQSNMTDGKAAYFRITAQGKGENLIVTIDEKQENKAIWHGEPKRLDESIYAQNTFLVSPNGTGFRLIVNDDGTLGTELME